MTKYIVDTNIFIAAIRNAASRSEFADWQRRMAPYIYLHATVVSEILGGASDEATWTRWRERWVVPAERVGRIITPGFGTWLRASKIVAQLVEAGKLSGGVRQSFFNDCLLAASCRETGYTIVTHNLRDFQTIAHVEPDLRAVSPFP